MDPDANLKRQQELLLETKNSSYARYEMYDLRVALREWLTKGGAEPKWDAHPQAAAAYRWWAR